MNGSQKRGSSRFLGDGTSLAEAFEMKPVVTKQENPCVIRASRESHEPHKPRTSRKPRASHKPREMDAVKSTDSTTPTMLTIATKRTLHIRVAGAARCTMTVHSFVPIPDFSVKSQKRGATVECCPHERTV